MKQQIVAVFSIILFIGGCQSLLKDGEDTGTKVPSTPSGENLVGPTPPSDLSPYQALVIGNSDYKKRPLKTPINDANSMAETLTEMGFDVILKTNLKDKEAMDDTIDDFVGRLSELNQQGPREVVGLFYFAGHGVNRETDRKNFLIPINDTPIGTSSDLDDHAVWERSVVNRMQQANKALNIAIVDACRDYALARSYSGLTTRGLRQAVERQSPSETEMIKGGTVIAFSASDGQQASDQGPDGIHGLYTYYLLNVIQNLPPEAARLEDIFMYTRNKVTKENQSQTPVAEFGLNSVCTLKGCQ